MSGVIVCGGDIDEPPPFERIQSKIDILCRLEECRRWDVSIGFQGQSTIVWELTLSAGSLYKSDAMRLVPGDIVDRDFRCH